jgi:hypothetical protein
MGAGVGWSFSLLSFKQRFSLARKTCRRFASAVAFPMGSLEFLPITDLFNESDSGVGRTHLER